VDPSGKKVGVMKIEDALKKASEMDLDLVEVAPQANPPVCRIMDYGKYRYELEQKLKKARKKQTQIVVKEVKIRPKIDPHDFETKKKHVRRFLEHNQKVKVYIWFRGREIVHPEIGEKLLVKMAEEVSDLGYIESEPKMDGRRMIMVLAPLRKSSSKGVENAKTEN
jgi:translation initiation factor IF-3